ncbi:hypothetical protein D3C71_851950 [compost metagenome]
MARRALDAAAFVAGGETGHVVHLQADQVTDTVREECGADAGFQRGLRRHLDHAEVLQHAHQRQVRVNMQLLVVEARAHRCAHRLLRGIDGFDHRREFVMAGGSIGAGDVAGITVRAGAGVDQEAAQRLRCLAAQFGVMQHGGVLVQGHDVAVRQFRGVLAHGLAIGHVDAELVGAVAERRFGRAMAAHAQHLRLAHQCDFIRRLAAAMPFQIVHHRRRVVGHIGAQRALRFTQDRAARRIGRQQRQRFFGRADDVDVEVLDPPAARGVRYHMPVVERLVEDHRRTLARGEHDPAVGYAGQRQPGLELRVDRIRVITVVEELVVQGAAGHHQVVEAAACQRLLGASAQHGQVVGIQGAGVLLDHCGGSTRKTALDSAGY